MVAFAAWLTAQDPVASPGLRPLQDFATAHAAVWPQASSDSGDYARVIAGQSVDPDRTALLTALAAAFARWSGAEAHAAARGGLVALITGHVGGTLLTIFAVLISGLLVYGILDTNMITSLAKPEQARGLITFLFSSTTVALVLLMAVATYWVSDVAKSEVRFKQAKDLLTLMIGIFGTILGFYYGSLGNPGPDGQAMALRNVRVTSVIVAPGDKPTISATVVGAALPITYDILFTDPTGVVAVAGLSVTAKASQDGAISEPITIPEAKSPSSISFSLIAHDAKGNIARENGILVVKPAPPAPPK